MPTRVTPYLGGTGQDNTRKLNVHPTLQSVSIGADQLGAANLNVYGNTYSNSIEAGNTFISSAGTSVPTQAFIGGAANGKWYGALGNSGYAWYNDTVTSVLGGYSSATYFGSTYYPKIVFTATGAVNSVGGFGTGTAFIRGDGTATFGTLTLPARNTVAILGNVYIDGNIFTTGNTFQITTTITAANANTVSANAFVVTKLTSGDIPVSNGITFSGANLVMSAYANPIINFSANNNVWISANTTVIGRAAAEANYNPYQLVDDGLVVLHNGGRGNILQTWADGRVGTATRNWGLGLTTQGDMAWLVGTAANTKPSVTRISIDQNGNVKLGTGTNSKSNLWVDGNVYSSLEIRSAANVSAPNILGTNAIIGTSVHSTSTLNFGTSGTWGPGTIYSDGNYGVFIRGQGAIPNVAELTVSNSAGIPRFGIDRGGNVVVGPQYTNQRSNLIVQGNAAVTGNVIVGSWMHVTNNVFINNSAVYDRENLGGQLTILQPGNITAGVPIIITSATSTFRPNGASWGFGINQSGEGSFSIMMNSNLAMQPNVEVITMKRSTSNVEIYANLAVSNSMIVSGNLTVGGEFTSGNFNRANALNDAAVQAACISRGWPIPSFGLIALPEEEPPGNMLFTRASTAWRFNKNRLLEEVPANKVRHEYDLETGKYLGWAFSGTAAKANPFYWSNNLSVTGRVAVSGVSGTFIDGEYVHAGTNTGIYVTGDATNFGIAGNSGILSGTLTGNTSNATATITAFANAWVANNMIAASNALGLDGQSNHATYLEATAPNATIEQGIVVSNATRSGTLYLKRLAGTGNINVSYNGTTWLPVLDREFQDYTFILNSNHFTETRFSGASGVSPSVRIRLETAGDKIVVGNMYVGGNDFTYNPIINGPLLGAPMASENFRFALDTLTPGEDFTMYVRALILQPTVGAYMATLSNGSATTNTAYIYNNAGMLQFRYTHQNAANIAGVSTSRDLLSPQEVTLVGRIKEGALTLYGNDRLHAVNMGNSIVHTSTIFDRLCLGERGDQSVTGAGNFIFKEAMVWSSALDDETMRLIGNGSKDAIPRPFIENAAQMRPVIQALMKLKTGGNAQVSIECVSDNFGSGAAGTAAWPKYLATYLDTTYSNSEAAAGWWPGGTNLGPARNDILTSSFPVGSWTQALRTEVGPSLGTSTTSSAGGYIYVNMVRALGAGAACRVFYVGTADGQAEYSWDAGATRTPLDFTVAGVGNIGYYDLVGTPTATGTLRLYRLSGTIKVAGMLFTNSAPGVVIHKMCNASGLAKDWYDVDSTQWRTGYEAVNPTASIIMLGTYDQAAFYNENSFAYFLQDMINRRRATVTNRPIMIVMPPDNLRANASPLDFYSREARRIASINNCTFVDLQWMFGNSIADYDLSWWDDTVNPTPEDGGPALVAGILRALENAGT